MAHHTNTCTRTLKSTPSLCFTVKQGQQIEWLPRQYYLICTDKLPLCFKDMSISQKGEKKLTRYENPSINRRERKKALKEKLKWHLWILLWFNCGKRYSPVKWVSLTLSLSRSGSLQNRSNEGYPVLSHGLHPDSRANCIICIRINS